MGTNFEEHAASICSTSFRSATLNTHKTTVLILTCYMALFLCPYIVEFSVLL